MDIFDLVATLSLDSSEYEEGLQGAESSASSVGSKILGGLGKVGAGVGAGVGAMVGAVGAGVTALSGALVDGVTDLASYGDNIDKNSQKLGISAEAYQEWDAVMQHSGASIDGLKMGIKKINEDLSTAPSKIEDYYEELYNLKDAFNEGTISQEEYSDSSSKLGDALYDSLGGIGELAKTAGLSIDTIEQMAQDSDFALETVITALQDMPEGAQRASLANEVLGRSAMELGALFNTSAEDTQAMRDRVHELGGVLSDEAVKASASFQDQLQDMQTAQQSLSRNMLSDFLPSITTVMGGLTDMFSGDYASGAEKISEGIDTAITNVTEKLPEFMDMGAEIILNLADSIASNAPQILKAGISVIKELAIGLTESLPDLIDTASEIITTVLDSLSETLPELLPKLLSAVIELVSRLLDHLPEILSSLLGLVEALADSLLTEGLPMLLSALPDIIVGVVNFIVSAIPQILQAVISIVLAIVKALPTIITSLISAIPEIITGVISAILENLPLFIDAGIQLFVGLIGALPEIIIAIVGAIPQIIEGLVEGFAKSAPQMAESGKKLLESLGNGLKNIGSTIKNAVSTIWNAIKNNLTEKINKMKEIGKNILQGLIDGIKSKISAVTDVVGNVASKISDGFKDFFGIASPSKLFKEYGKFIDEGFAIGVEDNSDAVENAMDNTFDFSEPIVGVTNQSNNGTMGTDREKSRIIELLEMLVDKDPVEIGANSEGIFNLVRKKSTEYYKSNNRSAFA